jgi:hypothetical protein
MEGKPTRRDWMEVGREYWQNRQARVQHEIDGLEWKELKEGVPLSLGMSQGMGIKAVIHEMRMPKVDAIAINGCFDFPDGAETGHGSIYGIQAHYKNADVRLYVLDHGDAITPLCIDVWEKEQVPA